MILIVIQLIEHEGVLHFQIEGKDVLGFPRPTTKEIDTVEKVIEATAKVLKEAQPDATLSGHMFRRDAQEN